MPHTPDSAVNGLAPPARWPLALLQARMAAALMAADEPARALPEALFAGAMPGAEGLRVHRNTVLGALSHALRLSYPAVDRLVGEAFFDRMAVAFAQAHPPTAPQLGAWGQGFADFIQGFPGTDGLPYLSELAQFDARFDALARSVADEQFRGAESQIDDTVRLCFAAGLLVHSSPYPVNALRDAVLADDAMQLGAIDLKPATYSYAMWRGAAGVMVQPLGSVAASYLSAALGGADGEQALAAALAAAGGVAGSESTVAELLQLEILQASFVCIRTIDQCAKGAGQ
jgi:Putative DNA-binding domain